MVIQNWTPTAVQVIQKYTIFISAMNLKAVMQDQDHVKEMCSWVINNFCPAFLNSQFVNQPISNLQLILQLAFSSLETLLMNLRADQYYIKFVQTMIVELFDFYFALYDKKYESERADSEKL